MKRERRATALAMVLLATASGTAAAKGVPDHGLGFDSPGVLDLSNRSLDVPGGKPVAFTLLDAAAAASIAGEPSITEEMPLALPFSEDQFACDGGKPACMKEHEAKLIAQADGAVKRLDKRLVVAAGAGKPAVFVDWSQPETKTAEGDGAAHWYLGRMAGNGYHRIEVRFEHDAPGNYLIDPKSGKVAFVHNGGDIAVPSADGKLLFTFNTLNPPLSLRVARLDEGGPKPTLVCRARADDEKTSAEFKGWHGDAFELVVHAGGAEAKRDASLRFAHGAQGWQAAASDAAALAAAGFACVGQ